METVRADMWQGELGEKIPLFPTGFSLSLGLHLALVLLFLLRGWGSWNRPPEQVIYSLTIESGSQKGRISQIPVKEDSQKAPPKPVQRTVAPPVDKAQPKEVKPALEQKKEPEKKPEPKKVVEQKPPPPKPPEPVKKPEPKPQAKQPTSGEISSSYEAAMQRYLGASTAAGGRGFGSDGRGGQGTGGGLLRSPEWFLYKDKLETHIKRGWKWHGGGSEELLAAISFRISPTGVLSDIRIARPSGNSRFDDSVLRAVRKANPVPAAPEHLYHDFRFVEIDFQPE